MDFDFQSIFIIYVIVINSVFLVLTNLIVNEDPKGATGLIIILNFLFVIIPIIIIHFFF